MTNDEDEHAGPAGESKSARKRAHQALKDLAQILLELSSAELDKVPLEAELRDAVVAGRRLTRSARVRHVRYLGGVLSRAEIAPIEDAVRTIKGSSRAETACLHRVERWRERLLERGDEAFGALASEFPEFDRQHVRHLIRSARRDRDRGLAPRHFRELLRYLRALDEERDRGEQSPEDEPSDGSAP